MTLIMLKEFKVKILVEDRVRSIAERILKINEFIDIIILIFLKVNMSE